MDEKIIWITVSYQPNFYDLKISDPQKNVNVNNSLWFYESERKDAEKFLQILKDFIQNKYIHYYTPQNEIKPINKIWITLSNQADFESLKISDSVDDANVFKTLWFYEYERKEAEDFLKAFKQIIYDNYIHIDSASWLKNWGK